MAAAIPVLQALLLMSLKHVSSQNYSTDTDEWCEYPDELTVRLGEALCLYDDCSDWLDAPDDPAYIWSRDGVTIGHTHTGRVHTRGKILLFLPLTLNDSAVYYLHRHEQGLKECLAELNITVLDVPLGHEKLVYFMPPREGASPDIKCKYDTHDLCDGGRGNITWYKDSMLLTGKSKNILRVVNAKESDQGVYTCVCTWHHGNHTFNTSYSTRLKLTGSTVPHLPQIILPQNGTTVSCKLGSPVQLECSGSCGISITKHCQANWNNSGYPQHYSKNQTGSVWVFTAVLTISEVTYEDLQTHFSCVVSNLVAWRSVTITLKQEESHLSVVWECVCVLLLSLLVAMAIKWFAVDLALLFRPARRTEDGKVYDAYVVYPRECVCEALSVFLNFSLPAVLEDQCGYKLFIHGRDDLPGEDQAEQVERCMRLSRRLLVVMTTVGTGRAQALAPPLEQFDWQMGLHSSLVQETMSVIMVQVRDGHTHTQLQTHTHVHLQKVTHTYPSSDELPHTHSQTQVSPGLQLLLRKSSPLRWEMEAQGANSPNSRFWKRVRYRMPPPPP